MHLIATDLDGTLFPNGGHPFDEGDYQIFHEWINQRRKKIKLAYITGRSLALSLQGIEQYHVPRPDFIGSDVGSGLYMYVEGKWKKSALWEKKIASSFANVSRYDIESWLSSDQRIALQELDNQSPYKISYYYSTKHDGQLIQRDIQTICQKQKIDVSVIESIDHVTNKGLIDILPANANKGQLLTFLQESLKISKAQTLYAGDTGNDLLPLTSGCHSVLVGNADNALRSQVRQIALEKDILDRIFFSGRNYVAGILDGLYHFRYIQTPLGS